MTLAHPVPDRPNWTERAIDVALATLEGQMQLARQAVIDGQIGRPEAFRRMMLALGSATPEVMHLASQLPPPEPPADPLLDPLPQEIADADDGGEVVEGELVHEPFDLDLYVDPADTVTITVGRLVPCNPAENDDER
jgi:hypothetical protein